MNNNDKNVKIRIKNLFFSYNGIDKIFSNFNYNFMDGEKYIIEGGNGEGKTTLLKCIIGSLKVQSGDIKIYKGYKSAISYCSQEKTREDFSVSVSEVLNIGRRREECFFDLSKLSCFEKLKKESAKLLNRNFYDLSGGEKQKISILRCLFQSPEIMLFDEPTSFLDYEAQENIYSIFEELTPTPLTIIITSHDLSLHDRLIHLGWIGLSLKRS